MTNITSKRNSRRAANGLNGDRSSCGRSATGGCVVTIDSWKKSRAGGHTVKADTLQAGDPARLNRSEKQAALLRIILSDSIAEAELEAALKWFVSQSRTVADDTGAGE